MDESTSAKCTACGSLDPLDPWYAACGSISTWDKNNWPLPNTDVDTCDDLKIWEIALCGPCSIAGYQTSRKKLVWISLLALLGSIVWTLAYSYFLIFDSNQLEERGDTTFFSIAALAGVIAILVSAALIVLRILQLKRTNKLESTSGDLLHAGVETYANRLVKEIEDDASELRQAQFPLPRFLAKSELTIPDNVKKKFNNKKYGRQWRKIVLVLPSRDALIQCLSPDWRALIPEESKANTRTTSILDQVQQ